MAVEPPLFRRQMSALAGKCPLCQLNVLSIRQMSVHSVKCPFLYTKGVFTCSEVAFLAALDSLRFGDSPFSGNSGRPIEDAEHKVAPGRPGSALVEVGFASGGEPEEPWVEREGSEESSESGFPGLRSGRRRSGPQGRVRTAPPGSDRENGRPPRIGNLPAFRPGGRS